MAESRLGLARWGWIIGLSVLTLGAGLGQSGRLTYHEAFVAQAAKEMTARGDLLVPTIGGRPWLEKPPLAFWLVALAGRMAGGINETVARLPSAITALLLVVGVVVFARRRFGPGVGLLAGLVQASTPWTVMRGRLAEVDIVLACLITWAIVAFDRLREESGDGLEPNGRGANQQAPARFRLLLVRSPALRFPPFRLPPLTKGGLGGVSGMPGLEAHQGCGVAPPLLPITKGGNTALRATRKNQRWRWVFFAMLGLSCLAKGVGFGAVLIGAVVITTIAWDRDWQTVRRLWFVPGWILAAALGLTWPILVALEHPSAVRLWALHVTDRLAEKPEYFIGTPWWQFALVLLGQAMPWAPLALGGAARSLKRVFRERGGADRLLWAWSAAPLLLLSLATVKSPHYAIHALPPWSVWAALGLTRLGVRLQTRGWQVERIRRWAWGTFATLGLAYALSYAILGAQFDHRGTEWAFYQDAAQLLHVDEPLALLYNVPDWDREPYPSPFGPIPHDLAVRLYYLNRPACWRFGPSALAKEPPGQGMPFAVIGRDCDLPALRRLGRVKTLAQGPSLRRDRTYRLFRVTPQWSVASSQWPVKRQETDTVAAASLSSSLGTGH